MSKNFIELGRSEEDREPEGTAEDPFEAERVKFLSEKSMRERLEEIHGARKEAGELKSAEELRESLLQVDKISPGQRELLVKTEADIQIRKWRLGQLEESVASREKSPRLVKELQKEAEEDDKRVALGKRYTSKNMVGEVGRERRVAVALTGDHQPFGDAGRNDSQKIYKKHISGWHSGNDPLALLESYLSQSTGLGYPGQERGPMEVAEGAVEKFETISTEAGKNKPDLKVVDNALAEFLIGRLEHFEVTIEQRVKAEAKRIWERNQQLPEHPDSQDQRLKAMSVEAWEEHIKKQSSTRKGKPMESEIKRLTAIARTLVDKDNKGPKSRDLASICDLMHREGLCYLGAYGNPMNPDSFVEEGK